MKNKKITSKAELQDKLAKVWETVRRDLLESVFYEWVLSL
jgi:hypothetical protein